MHPFQRGAEFTRAAVIVFEASDVMIQRVKRCSRKNAYLSHPAAQHFAIAVREVNRFQRPGEYRSGGCAQSL